VALPEPFLVEQNMERWHRWTFLLRTGLFDAYPRQYVFSLPTYVHLEPRPRLRVRHSRHGAYRRETPVINAAVLGAGNPNPGTGEGRGVNREWACVWEVGGRLGYHEGTYHSHWCEVSAGESARLRCAHAQGPEIASQDPMRCGLLLSPLI